MVSSSAQTSHEFAIRPALEISPKTASLSVTVAREEPPVQAQVPSTNDLTNRIQQRLNILSERFQLPRKVNTEEKHLSADDYD